LRPCHASLIGGDRRSSSGSLAKFTVIRRASSRVSRYRRRAARRSDMSEIGGKRKCAACAGLGTTVLLGPKVTVKAEAGQPNKEAMDQEDLRSYRDAMLRGPLRALLGGDKRLARAQR